ncbi:MAG: Wzt carbohydrate-binding domain-containing protein [Pirellulales bacterium]
MLLLSQGRIVADDGPETVTQVYLAGASGTSTFTSTGRRTANRQVEIVDAWLETQGERAESFIFGDLVDVVLRVRIYERVRFSVEIMLRQQDGLPVAFAPSGLSKDWELDEPAGEVVVRCRLPRIDLAAGGYSLDLILAATGSHFLDHLESGLAFHVDSAAIGAHNWGFNQAIGQGCRLWDVEFKKDRSIAS